MTFAVLWRFWNRRLSGPIFTPSIYKVPLKLPGIARPPAFRRLPALLFRNSLVAIRVA
jgi:hypothetical protein